MSDYYYDYDYDYESDYYYDDINGQHNWTTGLDRLQRDGHFENLWCGNRLFRSSVAWFWRPTCLAAWFWPPICLAVGKEGAIQ